MPAKAGNPALNEEQIRAAVRHLMGTADSGAMATGKEMVAAATASVKEVASAAADTAQAAVDQAKEIASDAGSAMATAAAPAAANTGKPGNEVYNMACVACHATGAANAPKLNDKAAWEPRAATGFAALLQSVLKGKGAMPAKGGLSNLSDADVENAVHYMLKEAGVEAGS